MATNTFFEDPSVPRVNTGVPLSLLSSVSHYDSHLFRWGPSGRERLSSLAREMMAAVVGDENEIGVVSWSYRWRCQGLGGRGATGRWRTAADHRGGGVAAAHGWKWGRGRGSMSPRSLLGAHLGDRRRRKGVVSGWRRELPGHGGLDVATTLGRRRATMDVGGRKREVM